MNTLNIMNSWHAVANLGKSALHKQHFNNYFDNIFDANIRELDKTMDLVALSACQELRSILKQEDVEIDSYFRYVKYIVI